MLYFKLDFPCSFKILNNVSITEGYSWGIHTTSGGREEGGSRKEKKGKGREGGREEKEKKEGNERERKVRK